MLKETGKDEELDIPDNLLSKVLSTQNISDDACNQNVSEMDNGKKIINFQDFLILKAGEVETLPEMSKEHEISCGENVNEQNNAMNVTMSANANEFNLNNMTRIKSAVGNEFRQRELLDQRTKAIDMQRLPCEVTNLNYDFFYAK